MQKTMGSFITSRLAGPILGALLVLALFGNGYQFIRIGGLRGDVASLTKQRDALKLDNAMLRANQATLLGSISTQNSGVDSIKSSADLAAANAKAKQAASDADAAATRTRNVAAINAAKPGSDACASASELIRTTLAGEHQQ